MFLRKLLRKPIFNKPKSLVKRISLPFTFRYGAKQNHLNTDYTLSGDPAADIYSVAKAQEGKRYPEFKGFHALAWCADFVSSCAAASGVQYAVPANAGVAAMREALIKAGGAEYMKSDLLSGTYMPQKGDIIIMLSDGMSHIGIVEKTAETTIYYIDGNWTGPDGTLTGDLSSVHRSDRTFANSKLTSVIRPAYVTKTNQHHPI